MFISRNPAHLSAAPTLAKIGTIRQEAAKLCLAEAEHLLRMCGKFTPPDSYELSGLTGALVRRFQFIGQSLSVLHSFEDIDNFDDKGTSHMFAHNPDQPLLDAFVSTRQSLLTYALQVRLFFLY